MDEFLHEYGYQGNRAADLYATVWREDPDLLRPILATMASMAEADGPAATGATRVRRPCGRRGRAAGVLGVPTATPPNGPSPTPATSPCCASR